MYVCHGVRVRVGGVRRGGGQDGEVVAGGRVLELVSDAGKGVGGDVVEGGGLGDYVDVFTLGGGIAAGPRGGGDDRVHWAGGDGNDAGVAAAGGGICTLGGGAD